MKNSTETVSTVKRSPPKLIKRRTPPQIIYKYTQYCREAAGARNLSPGFTEKDLGPVTFYHPDCTNPACRCKKLTTKVKLEPPIIITGTRRITHKQKPLRRIYVSTGKIKNPLEDKVRILNMENQRLVESIEVLIKENKKLNETIRLQEAITQQVKPN